MNKQLKALLISLIVLMALALTFYLVLNIDNGEDEEVPTFLTVLTFDDKVTNVNIVTTDDEYNVYASGDYYLVDVLEGLDTNQVLIDGLVSDCAILLADTLIGSADELDLSSYGFDNPTYSITVDGTNSSYEVLIGVDGLNSLGMYVLYEDNVYYCLDSYISHFITDYTDLVSNTVFSYAVEEELESVSINSTDGEYLSFSYVSADNAFVMSKPIMELVDTTAMEAFISPIFTEGSTSVYQIYPSDEYLEVLGFDEPTATMTFETNKRTVTITAVLMEEGFYCVMRSDYPVLFIAELETLTFPYADARVLLGSLFYDRNAEDVIGLGIANDVNTYTVLPNSANDIEITDEEYASIVEQVFNITPTLVTSTYSEERLIFQSAIYYEDGSQDTLDMYVSDTDSMILSLNGEPKYETTEWVDIFIAVAIENAMLEDTEEDTEAVA